jgi:hypothetical protein
MLSPIQRVVFEDSKRIIETFLSIFKLGIGIGATCLIYYLIEIEYLPNEISLGDGFILFFIAIVFSVFFFFFILAEIFLGMIVWDISSFVFLKITSSDFRVKLNGKLNKWLGVKKERNKFLRFKIKKINYFFLIPLLLIPVILFDFNLFGFIWAILIGLFLYLFFNIIYTLSKEYNYFHRFRDHVEAEGDSGFYKGIITRINVKNIDNQNTVKFSFLILIFMPIIYSGYFFNVPFKMLSSTMKLVSMRKENTIIYVKREYAEIIMGSKAVSSKANYYPISKVTILFKGVGKNTYLQVEQNNIIQRLEVPNDAILNTVIMKED